MVRDVGVAEELAQDALVAALEHWPRDGVPDKPGAWLMTTAKRRALDHLRRQAAGRKHEELATTWTRRRRWSCRLRRRAGRRARRTTSATTCCA
jgi:predicted RNA polymerase sigma factor